MLEMAKGMTPEELNFNFNLKELKGMASELQIKGRSKMDKITLALNIEAALEVMPVEEQQEADFIEGYAVINYHTGEAIETLSLEDLEGKIEEFAATENNSGFYFFLIVDTFKLQSGERLFFNSSAKVKHEVKTAAELAQIIAHYKQLAAAPAIPFTGKEFAAGFITADKIAPIHPDRVAELKAAAEKVETARLEANKFIGRSIKIHLKDQAEPFYLKVLGYAMNGLTFWGVDQEGQQRLIETSNIDIWRA